MNKIPRPNVDDCLALASLAANKKAKSYPHLQASVGLIQQAYAQYEGSSGNAFTVAAVVIPPLAELRIPRPSGHLFHEHPATDSTVIRPPIPRTSGHL